MFKWESQYEKTEKSKQKIAKACWKWWRKYPWKRHTVNSTTHEWEKVCACVREERRKKVWVRERHWKRSRASFAWSVTIVYKQGNEIKTFPKKIFALKMSVPGRQDFRLTWVNYSQKLTESFHKFLTSEILCNVTLWVHSKTSSNCIKAHQVSCSTCGSTVILEPLFRLWRLRYHVWYDMMRLQFHKYNLTSLRPMSHETFLHTILRWKDFILFVFLSIGFFWPTKVSS